MHSGPSSIETVNRQFSLKQTFLSIFPDYSQNSIIFYICLIQTLMYLTLSISSFYKDYEYSCILYYCGANIPSEVSLNYSVQRLVLPLILNFNFYQLLTTVLTLFFLGFSIDKVEGWKKFLGLFLYSGMFGYLCIDLGASQHTFTVGSSSALFGLYVALLTDWIIIKKYNFVFNKKYIITFIILALLLNLISMIEGSSFTIIIGNIGGMLGGMLFILGFIQFKWNIDEPSPIRSRYVKMIKVAIILFPILLFSLVLSRSTKPILLNCSVI